MYNMRESWTDERLDDFRGDVNRRFDKFEGEVDRRFDEVNRRFDKFEGEVDRRFDEVDRRFDRVEAGLRDLRVEMKGEIGELTKAFAGLQRTMAQGAIALTTAILAGFAAIVALIATQL